MSSAAEKYTTLLKTKKISWDAWVVLLYPKIQNNKCGRNEEIQDHRKEYTSVITVVGRIP